MILKTITILLFIVSFLSCGKSENLSDTTQPIQSKIGFDLQVFGKPHKGNLVGFEPYLTTHSYRSEETFFLTIKAYFDYARSQEVLSVEKTVVVLPESMGTGLLVCGEDLSVFDKESFVDATKLIINKNLGRFIWVYFFSEHYSNEKAKESLFRLKAWQMAESYQIVFGRLAREYRVDIIAGSIVLPEPRVVEGKITIGDGPLENVSFYFHSDGTVDERITRKKYLSETETGFIFSSKKDQNPVYQTPLGNLIIILGQDSWHSESFMEANDQLADLVIIPALVESQKDKLLWRKKFKMGKNSDVKIKTGMNLFMRGKIWNNPLSGDAVLIHNEKLISIKKILGDTIGKIYVLGI